jgi:hypothetical protein
MCRGCVPAATRVPEVSRRRALVEHTLSCRPPLLLLLLLLLRQYLQDLQLSQALPAQRCPP